MERNNVEPVNLQELRRSGDGERMGREDGEEEERNARKRRVSWCVMAFLGRSWSQSEIGSWYNAGRRKAHMGQ